MTRKTTALLFVFLIAPMLVGFLIGYRVADAHGTGTSGQNNTSHTQAALYQSSQSSNQTSDQIANQRRNAITETVAGASPAVVGINVTEVREYQYQNPFSQWFGNDPFYRQFFGNQTVKQEVKSLGSGFIISADGYVITNDHVAGNAKTITITTTDQKQYSAEVVGTDHASDITLLKIKGANLPYLKLGNSDDVIIGEWAIALGNPFGLFEISDKPTVTVGVVSAVGMNIKAEEGRYYRGMIQTDAAINSGNSGGPLMNAMGEVIGVNSVIFTPNQGSVGVGFAIPINRVKSVVTELKSKGKIERDYWTGIDVNQVDARMARYFGLDKAQGVIISDIQRGSPAERGGFKVGDIILEVDGEKITNEEDISSIFSQAKVGDVVHLKIWRDKQTQTLSLKLEKQENQ